MFYLWSYGHKSRDAAFQALQSDQSESLVSGFEVASADIRHYRNASGQSRYSVHLKG